MTIRLDGGVALHSTGPENLNSRQVLKRTRKVLAFAPSVMINAPTVRKQYTYRSEAGPFHIVKHGGAYHPLFQGHDPGAFITPQQAASNLARGNSLKVPGVANAAALAIPSDLQKWKKAPG
jgi:hypothetical protein